MPLSPKPSASIAKDGVIPQYHRAGLKKCEAIEATTHTTKNPIATRPTCLDIRSILACKTSASTEALSVVCSLACSIMRAPLSARLSSTVLLRDLFPTTTIAYFQYEIKPPLMRTVTIGLLDRMSERGQTQKSAVETVRSGLPPKADSSRTSSHVRFVPIVLQKSKIGRHPKSRKSRILVDSAAAILCGADTKLRGRFSDGR